MKIHKIIGLIVLLGLSLGLSPNRDLRNDTPSFTFDVAVTDKKGNPIAGLTRDNFKIYSDGVEQVLTRVYRNERPLALVLLVEASNTLAYHKPYAMEPAVNLVNALHVPDWAALVSFAASPEIVVDFTRDRKSLLAGLRSMQVAYFDDVALYDAIYFVLDRAQDLAEKRAILIIGSGRDTFSSRRTYGQALRLAESSGTTIYTVSLAQPEVDFPATYPDPGRQIRLREAEYTLSSFAEASGGLSFLPQFAAQYSGIYQAMETDLRNHYALTFTPTLLRDEGKQVRMLKVEVVGTDIDRNGKPNKLTVRHMKGY
jgi:VWFA-related protein